MPIIDNAPAPSQRTFSVAAERRGFTVPADRRAL